jgi:hypothetical protein
MVVNDITANLTTYEMWMVNACSLRARSHYQTTTRAVAVRYTGTSVPPTDAYHIRPVRMASEPTGDDDTFVRACRTTDSFFRIFVLVVPFCVHDTRRDVVLQMIRTHAANHHLVHLLLGIASGPCKCDSMR